MYRHDCLIGFGSNLGESEHYLEIVAERLDREQLISNVMVSRALRTPAIGGPPGQNEYLNACIRLKCDLEARAFMALLAEIETDLGRQRKQRWSSRTVDLDLLIFGQSEIDDSDLRLTVPHPRMTFRRFVLQPASEIAAEMVHPTSGMTISALLDHLDRLPDRVGFVSTTKKDVVKPAHLMKTICHRAGFSFSHFVQIELENTTLRGMKIVVYTAADCATLVAKMHRYPGPVLRIGELTEESIANEVSAALEATRCF